MFTMVRSFRATMRSHTATHSASVSGAVVIYGFIYLHAHIESLSPHGLNTGFFLLIFLIFFFLSFEHTFQSLIIMTSESVKMLYNHVVFEVDDVVSAEEWKCASCNKKDGLLPHLCVDPVEFSCCGTLKCFGCVTNTTPAQKCGNAECSEDCSSLPSATFNRSAVCSRQVLKVHVACPVNCGWHGPLVDVSTEFGKHFAEAHGTPSDDSKLSATAAILIPKCAAGCGVRVPEGFVQQHLLHRCTTLQMFMAKKHDFEADTDTGSTRLPMQFMRSGSTKPGAGWNEYVQDRVQAGTSVFIDVDTRAAGFSTFSSKKCRVQYTTSLSGGTDHWRLVGGSATYRIPGKAWSEGFRLYVCQKDLCKPLTVKNMQDWFIGVNWIGTCTMLSDDCDDDGYSPTYSGISSDLAKYGKSESEVVGTTAVAVAVPK